jgi:hypothetical protein
MLWFDFTRVREGDHRQHMALTEGRRQHGWKQPEVADKQGKRAEWAA